MLKTVVAGTRMSSLPGTATRIIYRWRARAIQATTESNHNMRIAQTIFASAIVCALPLPASAQQQPPQPQQQPQGAWAQLPRMQLERQFAGPLQDTIIQRWRDPVDGTVCYIYLPITAQHSPPTGSGYVQYGANTIGSISCVAPARPAAAAAPPNAPAAAAPAAKK